MDDYGCFSNFSNHAINLDGYLWKTTEHYFQAQKFTNNTKQFNEILNSKYPRDAANLGRSRLYKIREDWEDVKDEIMYRCVKQKVLTHYFIKNLLLSTGDQEIIEDSPIDYYWGWGKNHTGKNQLGKTLMRIRSELTEDDMHTM